MFVQPTPPPAPQTTNPSTGAAPNQEDSKGGADGGDKPGSGTVPMDEAKDNHSHEGKVTLREFQPMIFHNFNELPTHPNQSLY